MRYLFVILAGLTVAACDPTDEEVAKVRAALPAGCIVRDLGSYGDVRHLVIVTCDNRRTQTQSYQQHAGRTSYAVAISQID